MPHIPYTTRPPLAIPNNQDQGKYVALKVIKARAVQMGFLWQSREWLANGVGNHFKKRITRKIKAPALYHFVHVGIPLSIGGIHNALM